MKKIFALVLAAVTLALCLTGCVYEDLSVKLNKDGTGSIAATVGLKKDFVDNMMAGSDPFEGKETQEIEVDGDKYIAYTETKEYASFEEIEKALAEMTYETGDFREMPDMNDDADETPAEINDELSAGEIILTEPVPETAEIKDDHIFKSVEITKDGSKYVFDAVLKPLEGDYQGYEMSDIFKVSVSVEMPAKISAYKNGTVDGNKITFDLSDMSEELELYAECKTASIAPVIICGVLVLGCVVAFIVIRKRK